MNEDLRKKKIISFTDLIVWQKGHAFVIALYHKTKNFPVTEAYGLTSQIRRAAVSITSNIAEGFGRHSFKEKIQFYYLAHGSLIEVKNQLLVARDVQYLKVSDFNLLAESINVVHALLQGLIKKSKEISVGKNLKQLVHPTSSIINHKS